MPLKLRLALLAAAVVTSVGAYVVLSSADETTSRSREVARFTIRGDEVAGGPREVAVRRGDVIRLTIESDTPHVVHMHGYDRYANAGPRAPALFSVPATIEGVFDVEVHETAGAPRIPIATLRVEPS